MNVGVCDMTISVAETKRRQAAGRECLEQVKSYLKSYLTKEHMVNNTLANIEKLSDIARRSTSALADVEDEALKNAQNKLKSQLNEMSGLMNDILSVIESVADADARYLLEAHYIGGKRLFDLETEMNYSDRSITRIHNAVLSAVARILAAKRLRGAVA